MHEGVKVSKEAMQELLTALGYPSVQRVQLSQPSYTHHATEDDKAAKRSKLRETLYNDFIKR